MTRTVVGNDADFPEGVLRSIEIEGRSLLIARVDGKLNAMDGRCSHMGYDLSKGRAEGPLVTCRLHGAQFDMRTGEVLRNMSAKPLRTYPVTEENGQVFVDL